MLGTWLVAFCAGCASAFLWLSLGTYGLPVTLILAVLIVRLRAGPGIAGLVTGAGTFIVATTAMATARCDALNSATSSCTSFGAREFLVLGAALLLIGAGLTLRIARASRLTERR